MITVQGPAAYVDEANGMMTKILHVYKTLIETKEVAPLPDGGRLWGKAPNYLLENGIQSEYFQVLDAENAPVNEAAIQSEVQTYLPKDPEFHAAISELCHFGSELCSELCDQVPASFTIFPFGSKSSYEPCCPSLARTPIPC